jgi:two-component system KDP operon response regulator KdpE
MACILVIDDEPQIRQFLRISLNANSYAVIEAGTAEAGIDAIHTSRIDLVILDLNLPDMDGQDAITTIRRFCPTPIMVLSARSLETDKVEALDRGATDYMVKPFAFGEFMARVRAALRQHHEMPVGADVVHAGPLRIDFARRVVTMDGVEIRLSKREYELLRFLAASPDHVLTHKQILKALWGPPHAEDIAYLRVYVNQLRLKLESDPTAPKLIVTEPGVGYRLRLDPE